MFKFTGEGVLGENGAPPTISTSPEGEGLIAPVGNGDPPAKFAVPLGAGLIAPVGNGSKGSGVKGPGIVVGGLPGSGF